MTSQNDCASSVEGKLIKKLREELARIDFQHARDLYEFDNVDSPLTSLKAAHEGMRPPETGGQAALRQPGRLTGVHENFNQDTVSAAAKGLSQGRARHGVLLRKMERHK
jgi:hypothetical protein